MIIALDLEGTLISTAVSQIPRPGLATFLTRCRQIGEVVVFTSVPENRFRSLARELASRGEAPPWFSEVLYVRCEGTFKRLECVPGADIDEVLLVDDMPEAVHPDDRRGGFGLRASIHRTPTMTRV